MWSICSGIDPWLDQCHRLTNTCLFYFILFWFLSRPPVLVETRNYVWFTKKKRNKTLTANPACDFPRTWPGGPLSVSNGQSLIQTGEGLQLIPTSFFLYVQPLSVHCCSRLELLFTSYWFWWMYGVWIPEKKKDWTPFPFRAPSTKDIINEIFCLLTSDPTCAEDFSFLLTFNNNFRFFSERVINKSSVFKFRSYIFQMLNYSRKTLLLCQLLYIFFFRYKQLYHVAH